MDDFGRDREENKYLIPNIARAFKIIEYLSKESQESNITEISEKFDYPKNSVFRILNTLEFYGYLEERQRKYMVTPKLLYLGYAGMANNGFIINSIAEMHAIRDELNETVMLGKILGNEVVIIEQLSPFQYVKVTVDIGHRVNIHSSAPGKAIAAFLPKREKDKLLSHLTFTRYTNCTIPSQSEMIKELEKVKDCGYAIDRGEELAEVHCVGAPVLDYRSYPIGAVWVSGPAFRMGDDILVKFGERMKEYAFNISRKFGYEPGGS